MANECKKMGEKEREKRKEKSRWWKWTCPIHHILLFCHCARLLWSQFFLLLLLFVSSSLYQKSKSGSQLWPDISWMMFFAFFFFFALMRKATIYVFIYPLRAAFPEREKSPFLFPCVHCTPMCVHGHKDVFVIWSIYRYLCYHWDCSTFIKPDGNEVDENGICRIGHWLVWTEISKIEKKKSSRRHSTEISVIFTSKSSIVRLWFSGLFFPSTYLYLPPLTFSFHPFCDSYRHYFKIRFKIICFENLWVYMCYNTYIT